MRSSRIQNRIAQSSWLLPVTAILAIVIGAFNLSCEYDTWKSILSCIICAPLLMEINNRNALIRVRCRMVTSVFLCWWFTCLITQHDIASNVSAITLLALYYQLFENYQMPYSTVSIYIGFLAVGICSLFQPIIVCFVPMCLINMMIQLRNLSFKSFLAALLGIITPYWCWMTYEVCFGNIYNLATHWNGVFEFHLFNWHQLQTPSLAVCTLVATTFFSGAGILHFIAYSFNDKIKARMLLYTLICQELVLVAVIICFSQYWTSLLGVSVILSSVFTAHYFALTRHRIATLLMMVYWLTILSLTTLQILSRYGISI